MIKFIATVPFIFFCLFLQAQEICDNGIDDDGDSLVDLNDDDCDCFFDFPSGLIPNPSFEERTCCPNGEGQLNCANGWIQASAPTTDYVHTCGVLGNPFLGKEAPLPFPDGDGAIGFRDGKPNNPNFKEYAGAALTEDMEPGKQYRLDFFTGFPDDDASISFDMSLYGHESAGALPFGGGSNTIGCPANVNGWDLIDRKTVTGRDEWVNVVFEFVANKPYRSIVLGPSCDPHPQFSDDPYFFFDRLLLAEREEFGLPYSEITGSVCADGLSLTVELPEAISYQWYLDGVALLGADTPTITLNELEDPLGQYQAIIETPDGCFVSQTYDMVIPFYEETITEFICSGESYLLGDQLLTQADMYESLLLASDGCDSMVYLDLIVLDHTTGTREDLICEGDVLSVDGFEFSEEGSFSYVIDNLAGCDSTVTGQLTVIPSNEGLKLEEELIELKLGEFVDVSTSFVDPAITQFSWQEIGGGIVSTEENLEGFRPLENTSLILTGLDEFGCPSIDTVEFRVERDISAFIPNIFTPDDPSINQTFQIFGSPSVEQIAELYIYDRWGALVYSSFNTGPLDGYIGWDGRFQGVKALNGVYVYHAILDIVDGTQEVYSGDVTLIR